MPALCPVRAGASGALALAHPVSVGCRGRRTRGQPARDACVRGFLAALLLGEWIAFYLVFWAGGWLRHENGLPLSLCDWAEAASDRGAPVAQPICAPMSWVISGAWRHLAGPDHARSGLRFSRCALSSLHGQSRGHHRRAALSDLGTGLRPVPESLPRVIVASSRSIRWWRAPPIMRWAPITVICTTRAAM